MDRVVIAREEALGKAIDEALAQDRMRRGPRPAEPPPISGLRRLLLDSMFYRPLAGTLAALLAWAILEPDFEDAPRVAGEVVLVNRSPFVVGTNDAISFTIGSEEIIVLPAHTGMEAGEDGQAALDLRDVAVGTLVEAIGQKVDEHRMLAFALRPTSAARAAAVGAEIGSEFNWPTVLFFPLTAVLIALSLLVAEGIASRNWVRMVERGLIGTLLTTVFAFLGFVPAGLSLTVGESILETSLPDDGLANAATMSPLAFLAFAACRSLAWAAIGAATGLGMSLLRSTRVELRNTTLGGALGGALGGLLFDPIDRFVGGGSWFAGSELSRAIGLPAVGLAIGLFVALVDRLAREAWIRVRTGPLAGKSFTLFKTPTRIGSAPQADIYLFKDAMIAADQAVIHRIGNRFELEDLGGKFPTRIDGVAVHRHRLRSGDRIVLGDTILEFEERERRGVGAVAVTKTP